MNNLVATIPAIIVICYLIGMAGKAKEQIPDEWIPVIVGASGAILGVVGLYTMPAFPADNILDALAIGIASGFASTGINQVFKQLNHDDDEEDFLIEEDLDPENSEDEEE